VVDIFSVLYRPNYAENTVVVVTTSQSIRFVADNQLVRRGYYGQLRLFNTRLVDSWSAPSGRVRSTVVRIRS